MLQPYRAASPFCAWSVAAPTARAEGFWLAPALAALQELQQDRPPLPGTPGAISGMLFPQLLLLLGF